MNLWDESTEVTWCGTRGAGSLAQHTLDFLLLEANWCLSDGTAPTSPAREGDAAWAPAGSQGSIWSSCCAAG